jgi:hypothetical protein
MPALGAVLQSIPQAIFYNTPSTRAELERFGLCARSDAAQGLALDIALGTVGGTAAGSDAGSDAGTVDDIVHNAADRVADHAASEAISNFVSKAVVSKAVRDAIGHEELLPLGVPRRSSATHLNLGAGVLRAPDFRGRVQGESAAGLRVSFDSGLADTDLNFHASRREWS